MDTTKLDGLHPDLIAVVEKAAETQSFVILEGLRSAETQDAFRAADVSYRTRSKHEAQDDGFGHAVDLAVEVAGQVRYEAEACFPIVCAMRDAARELGVRIRWGGSGQVLNDTGQTPPKVLMRIYVGNRLAEDRPLQLDAHHFEVLADG